MLVKDGIENDAADAGLENMVLAEDCPLLNPPILAELIKDVGAAAAVLAGANEKGDGVVAGALVPKDVPKRPGVAAGAGEVAPNREGAGRAPTLIFNKMTYHSSTTTIHTYTLLTHKTIHSINLIKGITNAFHMKSRHVSHWTIDPKECFLQLQYT